MAEPDVKPDPASSSSSEQSSASTAAIHPTGATRPARAMRHAVGDAVDADCRLCGHTGQRVALAIDAPDRFERAAGVPADGYERYWLTCDTCGLLNNHFDHDLSAVYDHAYYDPAVEGESVRGRFDRIRALPNKGSDNWARVQRVKGFVEEHRAAWRGDAAPQAVLDIGAGTGIFLYRALEAMPGWTGCAVEPTPQACAHLRDLAQQKEIAPASVRADSAGEEETTAFDRVSGHNSQAAEHPKKVSDTFSQSSVSQTGGGGNPLFGVGVVEGYYRAGMAELAGRGFGLVTLNKVVEHVPDPVSLVRDAAEALAPGGVLYVEVPDKQTAELRPPTDNILGALHFELFDAATLALTFTKAGLSVLRVQRYVEPSGKITVSGFACRSGDFKAMCRG